MERAEKWIEYPERYYPPITVTCIMRWHAELMMEFEDRGNGEAVIDVSFIKMPSEARRMKSKRLLNRLKYRDVARIQVAVRIGNELFYGNSSQYKDELKCVDLRDLETWAKIFHISLQTGNKRQAIDWMVSRRYEIWQCYLKAVKRW